MDTNALTAAEDLGRADDELRIGPRDRECLPCYLNRLLDEFGCDNELRWTERWRRRNAPAATALLTELAASGGYCDCEVLFNVFPDQLRELDEPALRCSGVERPGSLQPCGLKPRIR